MTPAPKTTQLSASNSGVPAGPFSLRGRPRFWNPPAAPSRPITMTGLFPFPDGYGLVRRRLPRRRPDGQRLRLLHDLRRGRIRRRARGEASTPATVRLPSINLRVLYNGTPLAETYRQSTRILVTSTSTDCSEKFDFPAPATEAAPPTPAGATPTGFMTNPALPFGTYTVCVQAKTPGWTTAPRWKSVTGVHNWYHRGMKLPDIASPVIDLGSGAQTTNSGLCSMSRLRSQAGFTLPELLVAMAIGMATVLAVYAILDTSIKQSNSIAGRVNATQRGRIAMDVITRQLRSQVCYSATVPALVSGTDDAVKFHVDLSDGSKAIEQREIVFNPTLGTLVESVWPGQGSPLTFPTQTVNRQITDSVARAVTGSPPAPNRIFRYYAYNTATPPGVRRPSRCSRRPLSATDLARVAKIEISFKALPPRGKPTSPMASHAPERSLRPRCGSQRPSTHSHMRLIPRIRTRFLAVEDGFSMIIVMGVMAASALFVAAAFAAANGDLPLTRDSQDRKQAYAAAEAGINYYQYHLNQDPDYWTRCTNVPAPNATENQPVNQKWITGTTDPRRWRKVAGTPTMYTLELMPAPRVHELRREQPEHDDRPGDGHVQDPFDGPPARRQQAQAQPHGVVPPPLVPRLPLLHRLRDHGPDQLRRRRPGVGAGELRRPLPQPAQRQLQGDPVRGQLLGTDAIKGPLHTNDDILTCGTPVFGRNSADSIEFSGPAPGWEKVCTGADPVFNGPKRAGVKSLTMPPTNTTLQTVAHDRRPCLPGHDQDPLQRLDEQHDRHQRAGQQRQPADARPPGQRRDLRGQPLPAAAAR